MSATGVKNIKYLTMRILFLFLLGCAVNAQNLVQNGGFEAYNTCPTIAGDITNADYWTVPLNAIQSSDYYNICATAATVQIPDNAMGSQLPYEGNAYAGLYTYTVNPLTPNFREYLQTQLSTPLVAGQNYLISFYVSCADNVKYATNALGALLTEQPVTSAQYYFPLNITPTVMSQSIVTDTTGWTLISGNYLATGNEQYLIVGNLLPDASMQLAVVNSNAIPAHYASYYYFDNISVVANQLNNVDFTAQKISVLPNPVNDYFSITSNENDEITNMDLYSQYNKVKIFNPKDRNFNIEDLPSGIYYLTTTFSSNKKVTSKIAKL